MKRQAIAQLRAAALVLCIALHPVQIVPPSPWPAWGVATAAAASPAVRVHFDAPSAAGCLEVTPPEFPESHPLEKLMAVRVAVSLLSNLEDERQIEEVVYYLHAFENRAQIVDYAPKTTAISDVVGSIRVSTESKSGGGLQLSAGAHLEQPLAADASFSNTNSQSALETFERLPGRDIVVTSGTIGRGSGVYFKLRRHSQLALEGEHHLLLVMQVPVPWRADYLRLICRAYGREGKHAHRLLADESLLLPIYADGDLVARNLAAHLLNAQRGLLRRTEQYRRAIDKRRLPTLAHELSLTEPEIPSDWLNTVLWSSLANDAPDFERQLPAEVLEAVHEYRAARLAMISWRGRQEPHLPTASQPTAQIVAHAATDMSGPERVLALKVVLPETAEPSAAASGGQPGSEGRADEEQAQPQRHPLGLDAAD